MRSRHATAGVLDDAWNWADQTATDWYAWAAGQSPTEAGQAVDLTDPYARQRAEEVDRQLTVNYQAYQGGRAAAPGWWKPWLGAGVVGVTLVAAAGAVRRARGR